MFPIYVDEDLSDLGLRVVAEAVGLDWMSTGDARRLGAGDESQLEFATVAGRAILTGNRRDYMRLHTRWTHAGRTHRGILIVADRSTPIGVLVQRVVELQDRSLEEMRDGILFINNPQLKGTP